MQKVKELINRMWNPVERVLTNQNVVCGVLLLTVFWIFFCYDLPSVGAECLVIACVLWVFHIRHSKQMRFAAVALVLCIGALVMLVFSGKLGERGFNAPINHALKFIYVLFVQVMALLMFQLTENRRRDVMLFGICVILFSVVVSLCYTIFVDKYAIRDYADRGFSQVMDFNQIYAIPFIITAISCLLLTNVKKVKHFLVYVPLLLLTIGCVCLSLFTTALLLMALGIGIAFLFSQYYRCPRRFWVIIGVLIVAVVLCFVFRQQVSDTVYALTENLNWLVKARIRSVVDMILGTSQDNWYTPERRNELAGYSINSFLSNPLFGIGYAGYGYGTIGCHQEWFDMLGVVGIVGTVVFLVVMGILSVLTFRNAKTVVDKASFLICLFLFVVLGFLNPVLNLPVLATVFIIAPNISSLPLEWGWVRNSVAGTKEKLSALLGKGEKSK